MKYALVTGASSGCGYEYARILAQKGYNLLIVSNEDAIHEKATSLRSSFPIDVLSLVMDLGRQESAKELYQYCVERHLEVEVLVNNAGVYHDRDFMDDSEAFNMLIMNLHMITPAMLIYYFGQDMARRGKGYVLNMCSITADIAVQRLGTYGSTKAFLRNFSRSLYVEMKDKGVIITDMTPGAINTGLYNIKPWATKIGLLLGYIVQPNYLARRGVNAMFRGRAKVSVPFVWNYLLIWLVVLFVPTCLLRLIRKMGLF
ncbi:MAG: SDR family NAD(P)-dependent oxidoreductase [Paludibacteraceae bacterium]|nr:SDR family NAD(P)-dependent oxidoreductase [Paludibacteraceae bacterium]